MSYLAWANKTPVWARNVRQGAGPTCLPGLGAPESTDVAVQAGLGEFVRRYLQSRTGPPWWMADLVDPRMVDRDLVDRKRALTHFGNDEALMDGLLKCGELDAALEINGRLSDRERSIQFEQLLAVDVPLRTVEQIVHPVARVVAGVEERLRRLHARAERIGMLAQNNAALDARIARRAPMRVSCW